MREMRHDAYTLLSEELLLALLETKTCNGGLAVGGLVHSRRFAILIARGIGVQKVRSKSWSSVMGRAS